MYLQSQQKSGILGRLGVEVGFSECRRVPRYEFEL